MKNKKVLIIIVVAVILITDSFVHSEYCLKELENDIWVAYTIYSIISSLLIGIVLFYLSKKISLPLANLSSSVEAISDGHYGEHVNIKSNEVEIQTLIDNFNKMSDDTKIAMDHLVIEANKQKQFTANFSHELKTPLTTIIGYADLIKNYELSNLNRAMFSYRQVGSLIKPLLYYLGFQLS